MITLPHMKKSLALADETVFVKRNKTKQNIKPIQDNNTQHTKYIYLSQFIFIVLLWLVNLFSHF